MQTYHINVPTLKKSQVQLVPVNDLREIQPLARNVMGNSQKAHSSGLSYCLRQKSAFLEATLCL